MAIFESNIFSRASGSVGGITFLQARTRKGKKQTARERVAPTDQQTPLQLQARANMADSVLIAREIMQVVTARAFNDSVSKLPGYQSLVSMFQRSKVVTETDITITREPLRIKREGLTPVQILPPTNHNDGTYDVNFLYLPGESSPDDILYVIALSRIVPRGYGNQFRAFVQAYPDRPASPVSVDFGGFAWQDSGLLICAFVGSGVPSAEQLFSDINFRLFTT